MKFQITGKSFTSIVEIEDGTVKDVDNESISVLKYKNWDKVKDDCKRWGWEVVEIPEIVLFDAVDPGEQIATVHIDWPFPTEGE